MIRLADADLTYEEAQQIIKNHYCATCGGDLNIAWIDGGYVIRCRDLSHDKITKELPKSNREKTLENENRRIELETTIGAEKALTLQKYAGVMALDTKSAQVVIDIMWPKASEA